MNTVPYTLKITDNIEEHAEYSVQQEQNLTAKQTVLISPGNTLAYCQVPASTSITVKSFNWSRALS